MLRSETCLGVRSIFIFLVPLSNEPALSDTIVFNLYVAYF